MSRIKQLDQLLQRAKGKAANVYGQSYDLYRLSNQTPATGVLNGVALQYSVPMSLKKAQKTVIEGESFSILVMDGMVDNRNLQLGDLLVEQGYEAATNGVYAVAQIRPLRPTLMVRCEQTANLKRPIPAGGNANQMPTSGASFNSNYGGYTASTIEYATVTNGAYSFVTTGDVASIPINITPTQRLKEMRQPQLATQLDNQQFLGYVPAFAGLDIRETDYFVLPNGDKYEVVQIYNPENVGFSGFTMILEQMLS